MLQLREEGGKQFEGLISCFFVEEGKGAEEGMEAGQLECFVLCLKKHLMWR